MDHEQIGNKEVIKWRRMTKNYNSKLDKKRMHHMQLDYVRSEVRSWIMRRLTINRRNMSKR